MSRASVPLRLNVHVLQHVPFEGLGSIGPWLEGQGATVTTTRFFESARLPGLSEIDWIVALGGSMSVNDERDFPWLPVEKRFIADAITAGKKVLGICLGAQLIASALGARVYPGVQKEIGWFDIEAVAVSAAQDHAADRSRQCFALPPRATVFHWHGDTFDLPAGAVQLARSAGCQQQAFQLGENVIALQFHLETTPASAAEIIANCGQELVVGRYIQSAAELRGAPEANYTAINRLMASVLDYLAAA